VTDNEQQQYMAVVLKAIEQFLPKLAYATTHVLHGKLKLLGGVKMSSRLGNIFLATEVLKMTMEELKATGREASDVVMLGAIKYSFLKMRLGSDIIYDPKESVRLEGNSGPYLQYAHARACSILKKTSAVSSPIIPTDSLQPSERSLARKISEYPDIVQRATDELMPHYICTYLYELAQVFNRFYEHNHVVGDDREALRVQLVQDYRNVLKDGLEILGIVAPEQM
jgi:arginyl-tRNA synthetase